MNDVVGKFGIELSIGNFFLEEASKSAVFETKGYEPFIRKSTTIELHRFFQHAGFHPSHEAFPDFPVQFINWRTQSDDTIAREIGEYRAVDRGNLAEGLSDLNCAKESDLVLLIDCLGTFWIEAFQITIEFTHVFLAPLFSKHRIGRDFGERKSEHECLDPKSCTTADDNAFATCLDIDNGLGGVGEKMRDIVFDFWVSDIDEMVACLALLFAGYFAGAQVHPTVDLPTIG